MSNELKRVDVLLKQVDGEGVYSKERIHTPEDAVRIMADVMSELDREEVCVINVDAAGHPINYNIVCIGDLNASLLSVRNTFKTAIMSNAASILILHNHPSSNVEMSRADKDVTEKLMYASVFMDIPILDHIIVGGRTGECYSMRSNMPELFDPKEYNKGLRQISDGGAGIFEKEVREDTLFYLPEGKVQYGIYQIADGSHGDKYRFMGMDFIREQGLQVSGQDYDLVYSGIAEPNWTLDSLYEKFNLNHPKDYTGHSLSVSDVILWKDGSGVKAYYVDSFGFAELPNFIQQREEKIKLDYENNQDEQSGKQENEPKKKTRIEAVREITEKLEQGMSELFESERYKEYLNTMSRFHHYSFNNTLLIAMQKPDATLVASYNSWQKNFERNVRKGEKGIRIFAPSPYKIREEQEMKNPITGQPLLDAEGAVKTEEIEKTVTGFRAVSVFDVSQTNGKPLPEIGAEELLQSVEDYPVFMEALQDISPVTVELQNIGNDTKGYFDTELQKIVIQSNMSEGQTIKTLVHEIAHSMLHDKSGSIVQDLNTENRKSRSAKEVEAESVAYTVCQHFGIDTSDYSFGYVASWSSGRDTKELRESMEIIRRTASKLIDDVEKKVHELRQQHSMSEKRMLEVRKQVNGNLRTDEGDEKIVNDFKEVTEKRFNAIDGMKASRIEDVVKEYIIGKLNGHGLKVEVLGLAIIGSRSRGIERLSSDLDVVVEYKGDIREDDLFQILHEDHFHIAEVKVDINPITEDKTGTLASYLLKAQEYMNRELAFLIADRYITIHEVEDGYDYSILDKNFNEINGGIYDNPVVTIHAALEDIVDDLKQNPDTNGAKGKITAESEPVAVNYEEIMEKLEKKNEPERNVTYTVAECGEFHQMGAYYDNITTVDEALEKWKNMKKSPLNAIPALGIRIHTSGQEEYTDEQIDLVSGKVIDLSMLEYTPSIIKESNAIEKIAELIEKLPEYQLIGHIPTELSTQMILVHLDLEKKVFSDDERNLIKEYGFKIGDVDKTRELAEHIYVQEVYGNKDVALAMIDAREEMEKEQKKIKCNSR